MYWKIRFKTQVSSCSDFPSEALSWFTEVEMVDSVDELKSSRSIAGKDFPNFDLLDARSASVLKKIIQNSYFKKKVSLEEQKSPDRLHDFTTTFESLVLMIPFLDYADSFSITVRNDYVQDFRSEMG